jgi:hypothetical protein
MFHVVEIRRCVWTRVEVYQSVCMTVHRTEQLVKCMLPGTRPAAPLALARCEVAKQLPWHGAVAAAVLCCSGAPRRRDMRGCTVGVRLVC